ncbi:hydrogenase subunit MbhD domain-containing protein [Pseudactinotalea sp. Z1732]|uniref:hydrogenase subunit MbhD domain-containing protein n=2 Tax=Micrococcales TaxID=85006 RepID=UPI003C7C226F
MEAVGAFDVVLAVGLFAVAGYALFGRSRVHAAAMFLVFGVLLAVSWAWLHAPDVAIAEAVLGAGVTGVLVMNAVTATPEPPRALAGAGHRPGPWYGLLGGALAAVLAMALLGAVWQWQTVTGPGAVARGEMAATGVSHPVTAVLLNFRSYDTLLEIGVLAAAALGALALAPGGRLLPEPVPDTGPMGAMVRVVVPVLVLLLGWLLVAGSTRPGGAFQAGALLTGAVLMIYLAGLGPRRSMERWVRPVLLAGLAAFLLLAAVSVALAGGWLVLGERWAGGVILGLEAILMLSIGATLAVLLVLMDRINAAAGDRV